MCDINLSHKPSERSFCFPFCWTSIKQTNIPSILFENYRGRRGPHAAQDVPDVQNKTEHNERGHIPTIMNNCFYCWPSIVFVSKPWAISKISRGNELLLTLLFDVYDRQLFLCCYGHGHVSIWHKFELSRSINNGWQLFGNFSYFEQHFLLLAKFLIKTAYFFEQVTCLLVSCQRDQGTQV